MSSSRRGRGRSPSPGGPSVPRRYREDSRERGGERPRPSRSPSPSRRRTNYPDEGNREERRRPRSSSRSPPPRKRRRSYSRSRSRSRSPPRSASPSRRKHHKEGRDSPSRHRSAHKRRSRSRSVNSGRSSRSSDDERDRRRSKDKEREHKKSRHKHRHRSHSRERKKDKKEKKKKKSAAVTSQWGKYGIISESDIYNKEEEFRAWLIEERMLNRETMSKDQERKLFATFAEDYNTATLPHEKYYNMDAYEKRMSKLRNGELVPQNIEYDPNADMAAHVASHKRATVEHESFLSKEQLLSLRKVQNERIEAAKMKVLGLEVKNSMGVRMDGNEFE